jgi:predicted transcriptional regulator of viral defense system
MLTGVIRLRNSLRRYAVCRVNGGTGRNGNRAVAGFDNPASADGVEYFFATGMIMKLIVRLSRRKIVKGDGALVTANSGRNLEINDLLMVTILNRWKSSGRKILDKLFAITNKICTFAEIFYCLERIKKYEYVDDYLLKIRSKGRFSFTFEELKKVFDSSEQAIRRKLYRLKADNKIAIIRKNFYVVLPPEYAQTGSLPIFLYIDDLMKQLGRDYYLGLYSAASLYGAAHQQPMEYQVIVQNPMRAIIEYNTRINFFVRKMWEHEGIEKKKSAAGYFNVSSPELTALDFMSFNGKIGGISRIIPILGELIEEIKPSKMYKTAFAYPQISSLQRLGYLYDKVFDRHDLAKSIQRALTGKVTQPILLSIASSKHGSIDKDWKVDVNVIIEHDQYTGAFQRLRFERDTV